MRLLCHRGLWRTKGEQNSLEALVRAIKSGFGLETDVRDHNGNLVISHDPPVGEDVLPLERFLEKYRESTQKTLLAINIKADGLQARLDEILRAFGVVNYFVFDMSVPDTLPYLRRGMPVAVRLSEYEDNKLFLDKVNTVWMDAFESDWYSSQQLRELLGAGKRVCIVSPELHGRSHYRLWSDLRDLPVKYSHNCHLCTDLFEQAIESFDVEKD